jgi:hypothetical protein
MTGVTCPICGKEVAVGNVCLICGASVAHVKVADTAHLNRRETIRDGPTDTESDVPSIQREYHYSFTRVFLYCVATWLTIVAVAAFLNAFGR